MKYKARLWSLWRYRQGDKPCLSCVWTEGDNDIRYHWLWCRRCDWGNS